MRHLTRGLLFFSLLLPRVASQRLRASLGFRSPLGRLRRLYRGSPARREPKGAPFGIHFCQFGAARAYLSMPFFWLVPFANYDRIAPMQRLLPLLAVASLATPLHAASEIANQAQASAAQLAGAVRNCDMSWMVDRMYPPLKLMYAQQLSSRSKAGERQNAQRFMQGSTETDAQAAARLKDSLAALRQKYIQMGQKMRSGGVRVESFKVGTAVAEYVVNPPLSVASAVHADKAGNTSADNLKVARDRSRVVVLPTTLTVRVPDGRGTMRRFEQMSYILAVRDEVSSKKQSHRGTVLNNWYFIDSNTGIKQLRYFFPNLPLDMTLPPVGSRELK